MARWNFALTLERRPDAPMFKQIARAIAADIGRGRLRPGDVLPGSRTLARSLGVQRLTVVAAYEELAADGWVVTRGTRGTFVAAALPDPRPEPLPAAVGSRAGSRQRVELDLPQPPPGGLPYQAPRGALLFAPNRPDVRLIPSRLIGRAYGRALGRDGPVLLAYGRPQGHERMRVAIAAMLSATRGLAVTADDLCITRGSQMAIALLARALLRPGDAVGVEELAHPPAVEAFRQQGAKVVPIPLDAQGLKIEPLEALARDQRLRAVYVTPHHQFPTTVALSPARRAQLLALARARRFVIIEEDCDHEFHYDGRPVLPLASADQWGVVAYVGTLSKVLAPGLRIGYVVAPRPLLASVVAHRLHIDVQGDRVLECALAHLIEQGEVQRHIRKVRREYAARRDVLVEALRRSLPDALSFSVPAGGIGLWVQAADGIDVDQWAERARSRGAVVVTAASYAVDRRPRRRPFLRLGFAALDRRELVEGVRRLAAARPRTG
jgi:GntR family transcriptional regulator / MocR family aminotransferase